MRMSIRTTSGCSVARACRRPRGRRPPRRRPRCRSSVVEDHPEAGAHERLVVGDQDADAHAGGLRVSTREAGAAHARSRRPPPRARPRARRRTARRARACRRGRGRGRGRRRVGRRAAPSSRDLELERVAASQRTTHLGVRGAGVLERVGQRLLDDAVGGEVDARRQRPRLALDAQLDREPGGAALGRRARRARRAPAAGASSAAVVGRAQHAEHPAQLGERLAAGASRSAPQRRAARSRVAVAARAAPRRPGRPSRDTLCATTSCSSRAIRARSLGDRARGAAPRARARALLGLAQLARQHGGRAAPGRRTQETPKTADGKKYVAHARGWDQRDDGEHGATTRPHDQRSRRSRARGRADEGHERDERRPP